MNMEQRLVWSFFALTITTAGCSGVQISFRRTDPSFVASPLEGAVTPRVYFFAEDVPKVPLRSVGIVEVSVPGGHRDEMKAFTDGAVAKGKELGCWALVRHTVYERIQKQARAWSERHYGVRLVHGSGSSGGGGGSSYGHAEPHGELPRRTESFDCVVRRERNGSK